MHHFRDITKNVFQRIFKLNFVIFKLDVSRLSHWSRLINIQHVCVHAGINVYHSIFNFTEEDVNFFDPILLRKEFPQAV